MGVEPTEDTAPRSRGDKSILGRKEVTNGEVAGSSKPYIVASVEGKLEGGYFNVNRRK
jgi:hypothetical protein